MDQLLADLGNIRWNDSWEDNYPFTVLFGVSETYRWRVSIFYRATRKSPPPPLRIERKRPGHAEPWKACWIQRVEISDMDQFQQQFLINPETTLALALL